MRVHGSRTATLLRARPRIGATASGFVVFGPGRRQKQLKAGKNSLKKEHQNQHQINLTEPDAANMKYGMGKQTLPAYNAQVSSDSKAQLIVANDVVCERNDFEQFSSQHQAVEENLGSDPNRQFDLDSGYHSLQQLEYVEKNQIDAVMADPTPENRSTKRTLPTVKELLESERPPTRSDFLYCPEQDYYTCPAGRKLNFFSRQTIHDRAKRIYKSNNCDGCPLIKRCLSPRNQTGLRTIIRYEGEILAESMYLKSQSHHGQTRLKRRAVTVEPIFGNFKENLGFRRFCLRSLSKVKGEFNLMCLAHNINKLYKMMSDIHTFSTNFVKEFCFKIELFFIKNLFAKNLWLINHALCLTPKSILQQPLEGGIKGGFPRSADARPDGTGASESHDRKCANSSRRPADSIE